MKTQKLFSFTKLLFLLMLLGNGSLFAQYDGVTFSNYQHINSTIDSQDNIYTCSSFLTSTSEQLYVQKYNSSNSLLWNVNVSAYLTIGSSNYNEYNIANNSYGTFVSAKSSIGSGKIIKMDNTTGGNIVTWEEITKNNSTSYSEISDIKIVGNEMFVTGLFKGQNTISTNTTSSTILSSTAESLFIAKYTIEPVKTLVWVKTISSSQYVLGNSLDIDNLGNIYISGLYKGTTLLTGGTNMPAANTTAAFGSPFFIKLNSLGIYDSAFGFKQPALNSNYSGSKMAVKNSDINNAVYFSVDNNVFAYTRNTGAVIWTKSYASSNTEVFAIETNRCGDVYVTGVYDDGSKAICGGDFFAQSLNKTNGDIVWASTATSCHSSGTGLHFNSNDKLKIVGRFQNDLVSIDDLYNSSSEIGGFIGTYDDHTVNNCCKITIKLASSILMCGSYTSMCGPVPPTGNTYTYEWWGPNAANNTSVLLSTASCYTPVQAGTYLLSVTNNFGCTVSQPVTVIRSIPTPQLGNDIVLCQGETMRAISIANQGFENMGYTITWYINNTVVQNGGTTLLTSPANGAIVRVVVSKSGCTASDTLNVAIQVCPPTACFTIKNVYSVHNEDSKYGPQPVNVLCLPKVEIDGSCSAGEQGYYLSVFEFTLGNSWAYGTQFYSGWVDANVTAPSSINLTALVAQVNANTGNVAHVFDPTKLYIVSLAVGPVWNAAVVQFFRVTNACSKSARTASELSENVILNETSLSIFPNPVKDNVTIALPSTSKGILEIYSIDGRMVYSRQLIDEKEVTVDLSKNAAGIYLIRMAVNGQLITRKIIKK